MSQNEELRAMNEQNIELFLEKGCIEDVLNQLKTRTEGGLESIADIPLKTANNSVD